MASAAKINAVEAEKIFNALIDKGVNNLKTMETSVLENGNPTEVELLSNFKDFVFLCIDVKKKNNLEQQQPQQSQTNEAAPPSKKKRLK